MQMVVSLLPYVQVVLAVLLTGGVLLQQRGAGLGGAFGGDGFGFGARRGAEKTLFQATLVVGILFVISAIAALIIK